MVTINIEQVQKQGNGHYWIKYGPHKWRMAKIENIKMEGYGNVVHALILGEQWLNPVPLDAEFVGPIFEPS